MSEIINVEQEDYGIGLVDRPLHSEQDRKIVIDDSNGDSLQDLQAELPLFLFHDLIVDVKDGDYPEVGSAVHLGPMWVKGEAEFRVSGDPGTPSDCYIPGGINGSFSGKLDHITFEGLFLDGITQFDRVADVRDCTIRGNSLAAISGKAGRVRFVNCDIADQSDEYAVWQNALHQVTFRGCSLGGSKRAVHSPLAACVVPEFSSLKDGTPRFTEHHRRPQDGVYHGGRRVAFDG